MVLSYHEGKVYKINLSGQCGIMKQKQDKSGFYYISKKQVPKKVLLVQKKCLAKLKKKKKTSTKTKKKKTPTKTQKKTPTNKKTKKTSTKKKKQSTKTKKKKTLTNKKKQSTKTKKKKTSTKNKSTDLPDQKSLMNTFSSRSFNQFKNLNLDNINFVNFKTQVIQGKLQMTLKKSHLQPKTFRCQIDGCPSWSQIKCKQSKLGPFSVKTGCVDPRTGQNYPSTKLNKQSKVFVNGYESLIDYIIDIQNDRVSYQNHVKLFTFLEKKLQNLKSQGFNVTLVNHNRDVNILHFKFE